MHVTSYKSGLNETFSIYFQLVLSVFSLPVGWGDVSAWSSGGNHGAD